MHSPIHISVSKLDRSIGGWSVSQRSVSNITRSIRITMRVVRNIMRSVCIIWDWSAALFPTLSDFLGVSLSTVRRHMNEYGLSISALYSNIADDDVDPQLQKFTRSIRIVDIVKYEHL